MLVIRIRSDVSNKDNIVVRIMRKEEQSLHH